MAEADGAARRRPASRQQLPRRGALRHGTNGVPRRARGGGRRRRRRGGRRRRGVPNGVALPHWDVRAHCLPAGRDERCRRHDDRPAGNVRPAVACAAARRGALSLQARAGHQRRGGHKHGARRDADLRFLVVSNRRARRGAGRRRSQRLLVAADALAALGGRQRARGSGGGGSGGGAAAAGGGAEAARLRLGARPTAGGAGCGGETGGGSISSGEQCVLPGKCEHACSTLDSVQQPRPTVMASLQPGLPIRARHVRNH